MYWTSCIRKNVPPTNVSSKAKTTEEKELTSNIEAMAQRVRDNVHLYLKLTVSWDLYEKFANFSKCSGQCCPNAQFLILNDALTGGTPQYTVSE